MYMYSLHPSILPFSPPLPPQCMIGVVPLGTGNDMARVLGWGAQCHDEEKIPTILSEMEQSSFKLMDRWSIQYSPEADLDISSMISAITVSLNWLGNYVTMHKMLTC